MRKFVDFVFFLLDDSIQIMIAMRATKFFMMEGFKQKEAKNIKFS